MSVRAIRRAALRSSRTDRIVRVSRRSLEARPLRIGSRRMLTCRSHVLGARLSGIVRALSGNHAWIPGAAIGGIALLWREAPVALVAPSTCPGAVEWTAVRLLHAFPGLTLGNLFFWADRGAYVAAVTATIAAARRCGVAWPIAIAVGLS